MRKDLKLVREFLEKFHIELIFALRRNMSYGSVDQKPINYIKYIVNARKYVNFILTTSLWLGKLSPRVPK